MESEASFAKSSLYTAAVGNARASYYVPRFLAFDEGNSSRRSWNWASFWTGIFWFFYRKMYLTALLVVAGPAIIISLVSVYALSLILHISPQSWFCLIPLLLYQIIVLPMYANFLYYHHTEQRIAALQKRLGDDTAVQAALAARAPTSVLMSVLGPLLLYGGIGAILELEMQREQQLDIEKALPQLGLIETAVTKSYLHSHAWPDSLGDLQLEEIPPALLRGFSLSHGTLSVHFGEQPDSVFEHHVLSFRPSLSATGAVIWICGYAHPDNQTGSTNPPGPDLTDVPRQYLPSECR